MYQYTEARHGPRQASKINLLARIVDVLKLTLLNIFAKSIIVDVWKTMTVPLTCSNAGNCFPIHE